MLREPRSLGRTGKELMSNDSDESHSSEQSGESVLPLLAEEAVIAKQVVETGRIQIARVTHEREQLIDELLARETAEIERVRIGQQVDTMPTVREEGDTIVIPGCRGGARH